MSDWNGILYERKQTISFRYYLIMLKSRLPVTTQGKNVKMVCTLEVAYPAAFSEHMLIVKGLRATFKIINTSTINLHLESWLHYLYNSPTFHLSYKQARAEIRLPSMVKGKLCFRWLFLANTYIHLITKSVCNPWSHIIYLNVEIRNRLLFSGIYFISCHNLSNHVYFQILLPYQV